MTLYGLFVFFLLNLFVFGDECSISNTPVSTPSAKLIIIRQNQSATLYQSSIISAAKKLNWTLNNIVPKNCTGLLSDCACDSLNNATSAAKLHEMIILVVEDLNSHKDSACPYTAHTDSALILQLFHAGTEDNDYAITVLNSPAGKLRFEISQNNFPELINNVLIIMDRDYQTELQNPNTPPMIVIFNAEHYQTLLKAHQKKIESGKTPIGQVHFWYGAVVILVALIIGCFSIDSDPLFKFEIKDAN